jgi:hypothetical protein
MVIYKIVLVLNNYRVKIRFRELLTLATDGYWWSAFCSGRHIPRETAYIFIMRVGELQSRTWTH